MSAEPNAPAYATSHNGVWGTTPWHQEQTWMRQLLKLAEHAAAFGEVPVAAMIRDPRSGFVALSANRVERDHNPCAHAEMIVLHRAATLLGNPHQLATCTMVVTLEPCAMCMAALAEARLSRLLFAAHAEPPQTTRPPPPTPHTIGGLMEHEATALLKRFFAQRRHTSLHEFRGRKPCRSP